MRKLLVFVVGLLVLGLGAVFLYAAPTIGAVTVSPEIITVNTPTDVTVTAQITDASLIPTGVNLLRLNPTGSPTNLGRMYDDGTHGDVAAGDKVFSLLTTFNEAQTGEVQLQVSAAFRGLLRRVLSPMQTVQVWPYWSYTASNEPFTLRYPPTWTVDDQQDGSVVFRPPGTESPDEETPFISVVVRPNPDNQRMDQFYAEPKQRDLLSQSQGMYSTGTIGDLTFFDFRPVISFAGERIVVIPVDKIFIEIADNGFAFQGAGGVFDQILSSISLIE